MTQFPNDLVESIRIALEKDKKRVSIRIEELTSQDPFSDSSRTNDNAATDAEANEESSHDRFTALLDELKQQLVDINGALERIGTGAFGLCGTCDIMIDANRLSVLPTATLCVKCERLKK